MRLHLRRGAWRRARGIRARDDVGADSRRLGLPRLRSEREGGLQGRRRHGEHVALATSRPSTARRARGANAAVVNVLARLVCYSRLVMRTLCAVLLFVAACSSRSSTPGGSPPDPSCGTRTTDWCAAPQG